MAGGGAGRGQKSGCHGADFGDIKKTPINQWSTTAQARVGSMTDKGCRGGLNESRPLGTGDTRCADRAAPGRDERG